MSTPKTTQKLIAIDKGQGLRAYQTVLDHAKQVEENGMQVQVLLPWSILALETGLLFPEAIKLSDPKEPEKPYFIGTHDSRRMRVFLAENADLLKHYTGAQDKEFAHSIAGKLNELAGSIPAEDRKSPQDALRALMYLSELKKTKPRLTQKENPRMAPVIDTDKTSIEESIARAIEGDPLTRIASDIRSSAEKLPADEPDSPRQLLLARADDIDKIVREKHGGRLRIREASKRRDELTQATEAKTQTEPMVKMNNPTINSAVNEFFKNLTAIDAAFKAAGITDANVKTRFDDMSALEHLRPEGIGMAALVQTLYLSPIIHQKISEMQTSQWLKGRPHAAMMDFAVNYGDYLDFHQGQFPDGIELFLVTNNRGFNNGAEQTLRENAGKLRREDRFHIFDSADGLDRYFRKQETKHAPAKEAPAAKAETVEPAEEKKQRPPATSADFTFIEKRLSEAMERVAAIRGSGNWPRFTKVMHELLADTQKRKDQGRTATTSATAAANNNTPMGEDAASSPWVEKVADTIASMSQKGVRPINPG